MYELLLHGVGKWRFDSMRDALNIAALFVMVPKEYLTRVVRLGKAHIAFYLRTDEMKPDTYHGVITFNRNPETE